MITIIIHLYAATLFTILLIRDNCTGRSSRLAAARIASLHDNGSEKWTMMGTKKLEPNMLKMHGLRDSLSIRKRELSCWAHGCQSCVWGNFHSDACSWRTGWRNSEINASLAITWSIFSTTISKVTGTLSVVEDAPDEDEACRVTGSSWWGSEVSALCLHMFSWTSSLHLSLTCCQSGWSPLARVW